MKNNIPIVISRNLSNGKYREEIIKLKNQYQILNWLKTYMKSYSIDGLLIEHEYTIRQNNIREIAKIFSNIRKTFGVRDNWNIITDLEINFAKYFKSIDKRFNIDDFLNDCK